MTWECSECGGEVESEKRPTACPLCGLAGVIFSPAGDLVEDEQGGVLGAWFEAGVQQAEWEVSPPWGLRR